MDWNDERSKFLQFLSVMIYLNHLKMKKVFKIFLTIYKTQN